MDMKSTDSPEMRAQADLIQQLGPALQHYATALEMAAMALVEEFQQRRLVLQNEAQAAADAEARARNKKARRVWAPLNLWVKKERGTIRIFWRTINYAKASNVKIRKDVPCPLGRCEYDLRHLRSEAKDWEWELICEFEVRARRLRQLWQRQLALRATLRNMAAECRGRPPARN